MLHERGVPCGLEMRIEAPPDPVDLVLVRIDQVDFGMSSDGLSNPEQGIFRQ
jgi:hypothetical protein